MSNISRTGKTLGSKYSRLLASLASTATPRRARRRMGLEALEGRLMLSTTYSLTFQTDFASGQGQNPVGGLVMDSQGNIFGTTADGGTGGDGIIFEVASGTHAITTLASFNGTTTGGMPDGSTLTIDSQGNLYGSTSTGGADGDGTIYELPHGGSTITTLVSVNAPAGAGPASGVVLDAAGNLYGVVPNGGTSNEGSIFEIVKGSGVMTTLVSFNAATTGEFPETSLLMDSQGNLYGTTNLSGPGSWGGIFELPKGASAVTILAPISAVNGFEVDTPLLMDSSGNLYGVGGDGGTSADAGAIFELPKGASSTIRLVAFDGVTLRSPGHIVMDSSGDIFGVSDSVFTLPSTTPDEVFELAAGSGVITPLSSFPGIYGGYGGIVLDSQGNLFATSSGLLSVSGGTAVASVFEISPPPSTHLTIAQQPSGASTIAPASPIVVDLLNSNDDLQIFDNSNVTMSITGGPTGGALGGTVTVAAVDGVATFNDLLFNKAGTYTLEASDSGLTPATITQFNVVAPTQLAFLQGPTNVGAGGTMSPAVTVEVEDAGGNVVAGDTSSVTLSIATGPTGASLGGTLTVAAVNGVATFGDLSLLKVGSYTLQAADEALTPAISGNFMVTAGAAAQLAFGQQPTDAAAAGLIAPAVTVDVEDAEGNIVTTNSSNVILAIASGPAGAALNGTKTVAAVHGVATFSNLSLPKSGDYNLEATVGQVVATSDDFTISPGTPTQLVVAQQPTSAVAGATIAPAVTFDVEDAQGNLVTAGSTDVTLAIASGPAGGSGTFGGTLTVPTVGGVATFGDLSLTKAGNYTIRATDGGLTAATTGSFTIAPASPTQLAFGQPPSGAIIDSAMTPAVTVDVEDSFGNVVAGDDSDVAVAIASGPGGGALGGTTTTAAVNGVATFSNLSLTEVGTYTLAATDGSLAAATSSSFDVGAITTTLTPGKKASFPDANGSTVSVTYAGKAGSAVISRAEAGNLPGDILSIAITGSDSTASLTITNTGLTAIGTITDNATLSSISAKGVNITGAGVIFTGGGYASTLTLHDLAPGSAIAEPGDNAKGVAITLAAVGDGATINLGSGVTLALADWTGGGSITAPYITSLKTIGDKTRSLAGNLGADLNLGGVGAPKGVALGSAAIVGNITGGTWTVSGSAGAISAGATAAGWQATIDGAVASLTTKADAAGALDAGSLAKLAIGGDSDLALDLSGLGVPAGKAALGAAAITGNITGGTWTLAGSTGAVTAAAIAAGWQAAITGAVASITTKGNLSGDIMAASIARLKVGGDLAGATLDLTLAGNPASPKTMTLGTLAVTGSFVNSEISSAGFVGAVTVGAINESQLLVGVGAGVTGLAADSADFTFQPATASLASFTVKGLTGASSAASFTDSVVDAWNIGKISLKLVDTAVEDAPFGFAADKIAALSFLAAGVNNGKPISLNNLDPADLNNPKNNPAGIPFPVGGFALQMV